MSRSDPGILLIGPVTKEKAGMMGGATISFGYLVDFFHQQKVLSGVIDTQRHTSGFKKKWNALYLLVRLFLQLPGADIVMLNSSRGGTQYLAPVVFLLCRLWRKPFVFRPFGGDIMDYTADYGKLQQWIFRHTVLKADLFFLQTRKLMDYYANSGAKTAYLPTSRKEPPSSLIRGDRAFQKRFIFLGHIKSSKGVDVLLEVAKSLPDDYTIHLYGSLAEEKYHRLFQGDIRFYQGVLPQHSILATLSRYDVLVLPTFYEGEGYPGVIIEAFSLGLPVITTRWKAIAELVQEGETGLLVSPRSTEELMTAILSFNEKNYWAFSEKARTGFQSKYQEALVLGKVLSNLKNLL